MIVSRPCLSTGWHGSGISLTGIGDQRLETRIYPNPFRDFFYVMTGNISRLSLYDMHDRRRVFIENYQGVGIPAGDLMPGLEVLELTQDGKRERAWFSV